MAEPSQNNNFSAMVKRLEDRSYKTYKARLKAYQRLNRRNNAWNASLISLATSTTIASAGLLVNQNMYGSGGDTLMVALSILSLVASLVVSNVNYGARSRAMETSYKRIQQISILAENFSADNPQEARRSFLELQKGYEIAIETSENHSEADYYKSIDGNWKKVWRDTLVSLAPYGTLIIPLGLVIPFAIWFIDGL